MCAFACGGGGSTRPLLLGSYNPDEGQVSARYLDRFACVLAAEDSYASIADRLRAVHIATSFQVNLPSHL